MEHQPTSDAKIDRQDACARGRLPNYETTEITVLNVKVLVGNNPKRVFQARISRFSTMECLAGAGLPTYVLPGAGQVATYPYKELYEVFESALTYHPPPTT